MSHQVISAADVRGNFYGGLPYNASWSFNGGETPSSLTVSVVNERGIYGRPRLSFRSESVRLGNFNFNGYLTQYNIKSTPSQKILELTYTDQSIDLDRWFVALNFKQRIGNTSLPNTIFVGKQYHPCDTNLDSTVSYEEGNIKQIDNCDPCPFMPEDKYDFACDPILSDFEIFDVYYTFNELINKMPPIFNVKIGNVSKYQFFKAQHTGTLRSVLSSWCSDLGLAYFWDPVRNELIFIDRKKPINIPAPPNNQKLIDLSEGASIQNTFSRGFIGSFEKAGEIKDYNCTNETRENLKCLTIQDLFEEEKQSALANPEAPLEADVRELLSVVSYLGKEARTAFLWFWYYQNIDAEAAERLIITDPKKGEDDDSQKKILTYLGNMKIKAVYHAKSTDQVSYTNFTALKEQLSDVDLQRFKNEDKNRDRDPDKDPSYYFLLAEVDEELAERQNETDVNFARNFLGKFWYKRFRAKVPGANNKNSQVTIETPEGEGSAQWYPVDEDLTALPIFGFGHESKSLVGKILKEIDQDKQQNEQNIDNARAAARTFNKNVENLRNIKSFILMERNVKWHIPGGESGNGEDALKWYDTLFQWYKDISPQVFGNAEGRPDYIKKIDARAENNSNYKLFIVRDIKGTKNPNFEIEFQVVDHPDEPKRKKQKTEDIEDVFGNTVTINKGSWGLVNNQCVRITLPGITFFPPTQSLGNNRFIIETEEESQEEPPTPPQDEGEEDVEAARVPDGEQIDDGDAGFIVFATSSSDFKKVLPKQQLVYSIGAANINCAKIDYHIKQITEDNLQKLNNGRCLIDGNAFASYVKEISQFSAYTNSQPSKQMSFKMAGIFPVFYSVSQGLSSINIEVSDNGVFTSYNFEDLIIQPPSDSYVEQYILDSLQPKKSIGYLSPYGKTSIGNVKASVR